MGAKITFKTHFFDDYSEQVSKRVQEVIKNGALAVERDAKMLCPVRTGNLRASIATHIEPLTAEVGTMVEYAGPVEFGTKKMSAQPFLYPALEANKEKIILEMKKAVGGK